MKVKQKMKMNEANKNTSFENEVAHGGVPMNFEKLAKETDESFELTTMNKSDNKSLNKEDELRNASVISAKERQLQLSRRIRKDMEKESMGGSDRRRQKRLAERKNLLPNTLEDGKDQDINSSGLENSEKDGKGKMLFEENKFFRLENAKDY
jgi:hypothetical protein